MFTDSRPLPASGAFPTPGQDISGTPWQQSMRFGEIALFSFDATTGQPLTAKGEVPETPVAEYCTAFRSLYMARLVAKSRIIINPRMISVLYNKRGRWLATVSREGETRRNRGLGLAWILLQFPLFAIYGTAFLFVVSRISAIWSGRPLIHWERLSAQEWNGVITGGLVLAGAGWLLFEQGRRWLVLRHVQPARQPVGSPGREEFYKQLARRHEANLLVPLDITFTPTTIEWPSPQKYDEWAKVLSRQGFEHFGPYLIPEAKVPADFWFCSHDDLTAVIAVHPRVGMWLNVFTRYEDRSSFGTSNKNAAPIDPYPRQKTLYLGPEATADTVIEKALHQRPVAGVRRRPTRENLLPDYVIGWRQYVEWRRARGTTADEYKRIDEAKARTKAAGTSLQS